MSGNFIAYYRVSTERQGRSGLGLEAQQDAVGRFLAGVDGTALETFTEVESGRHNQRPALLAAIAACRKRKARLVIAKLDRLSRNAAFLLTLRDSSVDFVAADMPNADRLTVGILAVMAEHERDLISKRTREALAAKKARGEKLGNPHLATVRQLGADQNRKAAQTFAANIRPLVEELQRQGHVSMRAVARELNRRKIASARGGAWGPQTVANIVGRFVS